MTFAVLLLLALQQPLEWQLYQAAVAAADGSIQLNDAASARRWLNVAPPALRGWEWSYLKALSDQSVMEKKAHDAAVTGIAADKGGARLATTSGDKTVKIWNASTGELEMILEGHTSSTWSPAFRPGADELATMGSDGTVRIWSLSEKKAKRVIEKVGSGLGAVAYSHDGTLLAASSWTFEKGQGVKGWIHLWNADTGELRWKTEYGVKPIPAIEFRPDGKQIAVATWDGWIGLFSVQDGSRPSAELRFNEPDGSYHAMQDLAYSPSGDTLAVVSKDNLLRLIDPVSGKLRKESAGHTRWANGAAFSADGAFVFTGSSDGTLRLWKSADGTPAGLLRGHANSINAVVVAGGRIVTASADGTLRWWQPGPTLQQQSRWKHSTSVYGFDFSPDGARAVSAAWGGSLKMWETATGRALWEKPVHESSANRVSFSPDGQRLASAGNDGRLQITAASTGEVLATWEHAKAGRGATVAWSRDGKRVFAPSDRPSGKIWDASTGKPVAAVEGGKGEIYAAAFSPDSRWLAAGWTGGQAKVVDSLSGADVVALPGHPGGVYSLAFHRSGLLLATGGGDRMIRVWELPSGKLLHTLEGHTELVYGLDFAPDGTRLASASNDMTVRIWAVGGYEQLLSIPFAGQVYGVKFAPDGRRLAVLPMDGSIQFLAAGR